MTSTPNGWLTDPRRLRQLNAVAALVEAAPYDKEPYGRSVALVGKCREKSEYAAAVLIECGWMDEWMDIWACDLPDGRRHAVLCVNVADASGDTTTVVVDCRYTTPQIKDALPYTDWCKVE